MLDPVFGPFFVGRLLSTAGIWVHNIVAALLTFELTGSAFMVGLVSVAQFGPQLLLGLLSGAMADRGDRRMQVVLGRCIAATGSGGLALWIAIVGTDGLPGAWPVVGAALVVGLGFVTGGPAMHAMLPAMVREGELAGAVALNSIPITVARAAGPALGALIATSQGPALAFAIAGATNAIFAGVVFLLPIDTMGDKELTGHDPRVRAGLRYLRVDPTVISLLLGVTAIGVGADPAITLAPPIAEALGWGPNLVGAFASSFGIGAGSAFLVLTRLQRRFGLARVATAGLGLMGSSMLALAASRDVATAVGCFVLAGAGMTLALTGLSIQLQQRLPEEMRGRVMALWSVAFLGSRPFAAAFNGALADTFAVEVALVVVAAAVFGGAWLSRPSQMLPLPPEVISPAGNPHGSLHRGRRCDPAPHQR